MAGWVQYPCKHKSWAGVPAEVVIGAVACGRGPMGGEMGGWVHKPGKSPVKVRSWQLQTAQTMQGPTDPPQTFPLRHSRLPSPLLLLCFSL